MMPEARQKGAGKGSRATRPAARESKDSAAGEALYDVVARKLKDEIVNGVYSVGERLPTEAKLCKRFAVSRHTIRDALRMLREEGLVSSRQGAGTVVSPPPSADSFLLEATSINDLIAYATNMHTEIFSTAKEVVGPKMSARAGVASGQEWLVVRGLARLLGKQLPICWSEYYIHRDYAAVGRLLSRHTGPILLLIEDFFALNIVEIEQEISTAVISPSLASSLKVKTGTTGIEIRRTYKTADDKIIQFSIHTHPAPRFRYLMKLRRMRV